MKWFRPVVSNIPKALNDIFNESRYADKSIEFYFKQNKIWGGRDRKMFAESVYDIVRWWRLYLNILALDESESLTEEQFWQVLGVWAHHKEHVIPDWPEYERFMSKDAYKEKFAAIKNPAILNSVPDWIWSEGEKNFQDQWPSVMKALNQTASVFLRTNTLKTSTDKLQLAMQEEDIQVEPIGHGLILPVRKNVFTTQCFKKGYFEVQDTGSQEIAPFLQVEPGQRVMDACAGAGGKTLHLAALMQNKGKLIACDIHEWKLKELRKRARRAGVDTVEAKEINSKLVKRLKDSMDRLLLDVPCSGMGVLRRNPDSKWKLSEQRVAELVVLQKEILESYSRVVKSGGKMVYATCSILEDENQNQVKWFLNAHPEWVLEDEKSLIPGKYPGDGFYMARLIKP